MLLDARSLTYRQVNEQPGRFRVTKTYVTDPGRHVLQVDVRFESLTGKKLDLYWDIGFPVNSTEDWSKNATIGRNWPIFGGERGEYELLAGNRAGAQTRLANMAAAGNDGHMLPEQVWAPDFAPAGQPGFPVGEGTFSATPLAWSHAQFVRLAWSIDANHPVEQPAIVAARYGGG